MKPKKFKILIIEDNPDNHPLYRDAFQNAGFDVVLISDADGYFPEAVSNLAPDIISMDLMLGKQGISMERDGFEAIEKLKSDIRTHTIPIFVLTSFFEESKVRRAKELGAVDFINLGGQALNKIPEHYKRYLEDPKHYKPSHPLFRS